MIHFFVYASIYLKKAYLRLKNKKILHEYYTLDLDYSLDETEFEKVPEYLTLKLVNKSGDPPLCQSYFFIEKQCNSFDLGDD